MGMFQYYHTDRAFAWLSSPIASPSHRLAGAELEGYCQHVITSQLGLKGVQLDLGPPLAQLEAWGLATAEPAHSGSGGPGKDGGMALVAAPLPDALRTLRRAWADLVGAAEGAGRAQSESSREVPAGDALFTDQHPSMTTEPDEDQHREEASEAAAVPAVQSVSRWLRARAGAGSEPGEALLPKEGDMSGQPPQVAASLPGTPPAATPLQAGLAGPRKKVVVVRLTP